jgi:hypothetical protein
METAATLIKSALQEILVQASEAPIEADQAQDAIRYLNRMMAALQANGIDLGYTNVTSLASPITVPDGAIDGMVSNLALRLFPQYSEPGTPVDQVLFREAAEGMKILERLGVTISPTSYPSILPVGSGNESDGAWDDRFYADPSQAVLDERGGFISIETNTELP